MRSVLTACAFLAAARAFAHEPVTTPLTWTGEISRLVFRHCAGCHRASGTAMPLTSFAEARPWAKAIRDEVLARRMPPWDAVEGVGQFRGDPSLSQPEIEEVVRWVEGGAPEGDRASLPSRPLYPAWTQAPAPRGRILRIAGSEVLREPAVLLGVTPQGPLELTAVLPGGRVERILWVRNFRPEWNRTYVLREPLRLPRGTRIWVYSRDQAFAQLLTGAAPGS